jgi:hypothetical protein
MFPIRPTNLSKPNKGSNHSLVCSGLITPFPPLVGIQIICLTVMRRRRCSTREYALSTDLASTARGGTAVRVAGGAATRASLAGTQLQPLRPRAPHPAT